jgi:hypothetical protein
MLTSCGGRSGVLVCMRVAAGAYAYTQVRNSEGDRTEDDSDLMLKALKNLPLHLQKL